MRGRGIIAISRSCQQKAVTGYFDMMIGKLVLVVNVERRGKLVTQINKQIRLYNYPEKNNIMSRFLWLTNC